MSLVTMVAEAPTYAVLSLDGGKLVLDANGEKSELEGLHNMWELGAIRSVLMVVNHTRRGAPGWPQWWPFV